MRKIASKIPNAELLLALEPEELAGELLFLMKERPDDLHNPHNYELELWGGGFGHGDPPYPQAKEPQITLALSEAFSWLKSQGFLVPASGSNGQNGFCVLSRRARSLTNSSEFADFRTARLLPKEILHERIASSAWLSFMRAAYSTAVFEAMREVEIAVREAAQYHQGDHGVPMIRRAFHKETGPLTDTGTEEAEREALSNLFAGAIGSYKNPHSHRHVDFDSPIEAAEVILLASHLLRIVDSRRVTSSE